MFREILEKIHKDLIKLIANHLYAIILTLITILTNAYKNNISNLLNIEFTFRITGNAIVVILTTITIIVWIIEINTRKKYKFFPKKVKYKYIYEFYRIRLVYNSSENLDFCRRSVIKVLSPDFDKIMGKYSWSGKKVNKIYLDRDSDKYFHFHLLRKNNQTNLLYKTDSDNDFPIEGNYEIIIKDPIKINQIVTLDFAFSMIDNKNQKKQFIGIIVQRPTKKLELSVEFSQDVKPIKIRAKRRLIVGDRTCETINPKMISKSLKGYGRNLKIVYTLKISNPEIFYNYILEWYFDYLDNEKITNDSNTFEDQLIHENSKI
ncbi:hypothetical protein KEC48_02940 [Clostridium sp. C1]|uniref:hypothetical protein n=1 Tax=Clostridium sp. C1 TaxID=1155388 RepID=UPI001BA5E175|nr:hypothetical protein [Clostridium sp. C1]QUN13498.1 hypothetical protein KEC48_02940 [Clostridium sp. C1]